MVGEKNVGKDCCYKCFSFNIVDSVIPSIFTLFKTRYDSDYWCIWCNNYMVDYCIHNDIL